MNRIIIHYEGMHDGDSAKGLQPKLDPVNIWTEGWGHAILDEKGKFLKGIENKDKAYKLSKVHTVDDADNMLISDLIPINDLINRNVNIKLTECQKEAIQSFYYNCGYSETLTRLINQNSPDLYDWWASHYITGGGIKLQGLIYRRKTEAILFMTEKLEFFN